MTTANYQTDGIETIHQSADTRVVEITLAPRSDTPEHRHSSAKEICYCLEGELTIEQEGRPVVALIPGQRCVFAADAPHRLRNVADRPCRFLLIHVDGAFDFVAAER